jgi:hypothetical protein
LTLLSSRFRGAVTVLLSPGTTARVRRICADRGRWPLAAEGDCGSSLDDREVEPVSEAGLSRRERIANIWEAAREAQGLWAWGSDQGFVPWTDSLGHDVMPLWTSAAQATSENQDDGDPDERPVFLSIDDLLERIPSWQQAGVDETGLQSENGGRFLLTIPLSELADRLSR